MTDKKWTDQPISTKSFWINGRGGKEAWEKQEKWREANNQNQHQPKPVINKNKIEDEPEPSQHELSEIKKRITGINSETKRMERDFNEIAKSCKIEWFRNKWITQPPQNKVKEIIYWLS